MADSPGKISIIGAGSVGATLAYACLIRGVSRHLALYDLDKAKVLAETMDLNHGLQFVPEATVEGGDDLAIIAHSSVVVITAGAKQKPGQTRLELASTNAAICRDLVPKVLHHAPAAKILMVTNPVDVLTYAALKVSGLPRSHVLGSGTVLDSSRFRYLIARRCRVSVANVHGYIVGEHGDSEIPLWSSTSIGAVPLSQWAVPAHGKLTVRDRAEIFESVKTAAQQIIQGKGATNLAIALAGAGILQAILRDQNAVLPVTSLMENYQGLCDVCLSVPCIVGANGVEAPLAVPMNEAERAGLAASAAAVKAAIRSAGF